jgi:hypothetical protein
VAEDLYQPIRRIKLQVVFDVRLQGYSLLDVWYAKCASGFR